MRWWLLLQGCVPNGLGGCSENGDGSTLAKGKIVWSDEFDYAGQPNNNWIQEYREGGRGNNELQFYTNGGKNAQVAGGNLVITSKKEEYGGKLFCKSVFFYLTNKF